MGQYWVAAIQKVGEVRFLKGVAFDSQLSGPNSHWCPDVKHTGVTSGIENNR